MFTLEVLTVLLAALDTVVSESPFLCTQNSGDRLTASPCVLLDASLVLAAEEGRSAVRRDDHASSTLSGGTVVPRTDPRSGQSSCSRWRSYPILQKVSLPATPSTTLELSRKELIYEGKSKCKCNFVQFV